MNIRLSDKHGVNPAIPLCFVCLQQKNEIILTGRLPGDAEAPRNVVWDMAPCDKCKEFMRQGVILISVKDGEPVREGQAYQQAKAEYERNVPAWERKRKPFRYIQNPYRTGGFVVMTEEWVTRVVNEPMCSQLLATRLAFIEDSIWDAIGLPRHQEETDGSESDD